MTIEPIPINTKDLPEGSVVRLFRVADETTEHYVQVGYVETGRYINGEWVVARDQEGTRSKGVAFSACTCPEGFTSIALSLCGRKPRACPHVDAVVLSLAEEKNELV